MSSRQMWPPRVEFSSKTKISKSGILQHFWFFTFFEGLTSLVLDTLSSILGFRLEIRHENFFQTVTGPRCSARPVGLLNKRLCWQRPKHQSEMEFGPKSRSSNSFCLKPGLTGDTWLLSSDLEKYARNDQKQKFLLCFAFALAQWGSALSISSLHCEILIYLSKMPKTYLF